ncbi:MAG: hypothetical protein HZA77_14395 [Candidatus Schekmanbacteria bacterium]|nr:hypothetical protein [Candidatus Schekmanbacteria bacterium]
MEKEIETKEGTGFFSRYKGEIIFTLLIIYVLLLALGTVGELFDVEWILKLPIFN